VKTTPAVPARKSAQIILRVTPEQKSRFEEAAASTGRSLTDLATEALHEKTLQIAQEQRDITVWRLSRADAEAFATALIAPPKPTVQMLADIAEYQAMKSRHFDTEA